MALVALVDRRSPEGMWVVEHVDGRPFQALRPSLVHFEGGAMRATVGCNRLDAEFRLMGARLTWTQVHGQTLRACPPAQIMVQEALVFDRLMRAQRLERLPNDRLLLTAGDGHSIHLRRQP